MKGILFILTVIGIILIAIGMNAAVVYGICWALVQVGITHIGTWEVQFSWALVILFILVTGVISSIVNISVHND